MSSTLAITCFLLRFCHLIHSFRLVPSIGFFILTTKKMCISLLQFAVVFSVVLLAIAFMFHLVARDPDCPARKIEEFTSLAHSLLSVYKLAIGYGNANYSEHNVNTLITFIIASIVIMLMMLNLIIAVMTTAATDMNQAPWKTTVCRVEKWNEILGAETDVLVMKIIVRSLCKGCVSQCHGLSKWCKSRRSDKDHKPIQYTVVIDLVKEHEE